MAEKPISILIPNYNHAGTLKACIESVFDLADYPNFDVIVIDDGSTDNSLEILQSIPGIRIVRQPHRGVAKALNHGIRICGENDVVRLHADVIIETRGWLNQLIEVVETKPKAGIVGAKLVYPDDSIQCNGRNLVQGMGFREQHANRNFFVRDNPKVNSVNEVDAVHGGLAYYRREVITKTGGLDENYFPVWTDDDDFCISARYHGYKAYVHSGVKAVHYGITWGPESKSEVPGTAETIQKFNQLKPWVLKQHYRYWQQKWGWHPLNPDLNEIRRLYQDTEICWKIGERLRYKTTHALPGVDACLVTWNCLPDLNRTLDSLATTDYPQDLLKVYVTDNGSQDGTCEYLDDLITRFPFELHVDHLPVNAGAPVGLNWAFSQGQAEMVAKLDDDILLPPDWLKILVEVFNKRPYAGVAGGKVINANSRAAIQVGLIRFFPGYFNYEDQDDNGQVDFLGRAVHVPGSCNLYRREALKNAGLLDIRYSPSQFDDYDHHAILNNLGYEVIYDSRLRYQHALNSRYHSYAAIGNTEGNHVKMVWKWGGDIFEILEKNLDLSREGRILPDDGDSRRLLEHAPAPKEFPRPASLKVRPADQLRRLKILDLRREISQQSFLEEYLDLARYSHRNFNHFRPSMHALWAAINLAPHRPEVIVALANNFLALGEYPLAVRMLERACKLAPRDEQVQMALQAAQNRLDEAGKASQAIGGDQDGLLPSYPEHLQYRFTHIGESRPQSTRLPTVKSNTRLKILLVNSYEPHIAAGDTVQMKKLQEVYRGWGIDAKIDCRAKPDVNGVDLVHIWNRRWPHQALAQVKAIKAQAASLPVIMTPMYTNYRPGIYAEMLLPALFERARNKAEIAKGLAELFGQADADTDEEPNFENFRAYEQDVLNLVDGLITTSKVDINAAKKLLLADVPSAVAHSGVEDRLFEAGDPRLFIERYGIKDFVLMVGRVEARKNQLLALYSLYESGLPIVVVGTYAELYYYKLCQKFAPAKTLFLPNLSHEELASVYKAARVHVMTSFSENSYLASLEAAAAGRSIVLGNLNGEAEYFGENARYCDPTDPQSISQAVIEAYHKFDAEKSRRVQFQRLINEKYSWEASAFQTLASFRSICEQTGNQLLAEKIQVFLSNQREVELNPGGNHSRASAKKKAVDSSRPSLQGKVDIVIPIYGQTQLLKRCVDSVLRTTSNTHLFLVDDCSPGSEVEQAFEGWKAESRITLVRTPENLGFLETSRYGARLGTSEWILFLNSDVEAHQPGWIESMLPSERDVAIVGARLVYPPDAPEVAANQLQHAGIARNSEGIPYHPFLCGDPEVAAVSRPKDVNAVTGACFLVRRSVWQELGGWDARFGRGVYEDVDFCWQARKQGYRVRYQAEACLRHYESASRSQDGGHSLNEHTLKNLQALLKKWGNLGSDENLYYGRYQWERWQEARKELLLANSARAGKDGQKVAASLQRVIKIAPDLPEGLLANAQWQSEHGQHWRAAETLLRLLQLNPLNWEARLRLVDQYLQIEQLDLAGEALEQIEQVYNEHPEVQTRRQQINERQSNPIGKPGPEMILAGLLEAEDLPAALKQFEPAMDERLLVLVKANWENARQNGQIELAEGLEALAIYIENCL